MKTTLLCATALALTAATANAQFFNQNIGTLMSHTHNDSIATTSLSFPFTFPDGSVATSIDVDANGRILPGGTGTSDFSETVGEFNAATMICPCWDDLGTWQAAPGDVYFSDDGNQATITWCETKKFPSTVPGRFTLQAQLFANGDIAFCYDGRIPADNRPHSSDSGIVGISGADPLAAEVDLTDPTLTSGGPSIFEEFNGAANGLDLRHTGILFQANGPGAYNIVRIDDPGIIPCGGAERFGRSCGVTFSFVNNGDGTFAFFRDRLQWVDDGGTVDDPNPGLVTGNLEHANGNGGGGTLADDNNTPPIAVGFNFTFPGATGPVNTVVLDNNGRVMADGSDPGDFSASIAEFLAGPPTIAPWWTDLSSQHGSLRTRQEAGQFVITWDSVPKWAEVEPHTLQVVLFDNDNFNINYRDVTWYQTEGVGTGDNVLVGSSPGAGHSDPGQQDFSTPAQFLLTDPAIYEYWGVTGPSGLHGPDIHTKLLPVGVPSIGGNLEFQITGITTGTSALHVFIGLSSLPEAFADLTPLNIGLAGCNFYINDFVNDLDLIGGYTPGSSTFALSTAIPADPGLAGLHFVLQGVTVDVSGINVCAGATNLDCVTLTNALRLTFR